MSDLKTIIEDSFQQYAGAVLQLVREKFIIPTFSMTGLKNQNIKICLNT